MRNGNGSGKDNEKMRHGCHSLRKIAYLCRNNYIMALEIKPIPVLRGKAAERFVEEADRNARERRGSIDFTKQVEKMRAILKRSRLYNIDKEG